jgi:uncharacterized membrane protein YkvA (DUF1232 family)
MTIDGLNTGESTPRFYDALKTRLLGWAGERLGQRLKQLAEFALLVPDVIVLLGRVLLDQRVPRHLRLKVGMIVTYLASPLDLLPEAVVGPAGLLDDLVLIVFALNRVFVCVDGDILHEHWPGRPEQLDVLRELSDLTGSILTGRYGEQVADWYERPMEQENVPGGEARVELVSEGEESEEVQVERFRAAGL